MAKKAIKLTKQGFEALAEAIRPVEPLAARLALIQRLLPALYAGNPRFEAVRFAKACNASTLVFSGATDAPNTDEDF